MKYFLFITISNDEGCSFFLDFNEFLDRSLFLNEFQTNKEEYIYLSSIHLQLYDSMLKKYGEKFGFKISKNTKWIYGVSKINDFKITDNSNNEIYLSEVAHIRQCL